jgi:hypothetical protein
LRAFSALWLVFAAASSVAQPAEAISIAAATWADVLERIYCLPFKQNPDGSYTISGPFEIDGKTFDSITTNDRKIIEALESSCAGGGGAGAGGGGSAGAIGSVGASGAGPGSSGAGGGSGAGGSGQSPGNAVVENAPDVIVVTEDIDHKATQPIAAAPGPIVGGGLVGLLAWLGALVLVGMRWMRGTGRLSGARVRPLRRRVVTCPRGMTMG